MQLPTSVEQLARTHIRQVSDEASTQRGAQAGLEHFCNASNNGRATVGSARAAQRLTQASMPSRGQVSAQRAVAEQVSPVGAASANKLPRNAARQTIRRGYDPMI